MEQQLEARSIALTSKRRRKTSIQSKKHLRLKDLPPETRIMIFELAIKFHPDTFLMVVALQGKKRLDEPEHLPRESASPVPAPVPDRKNVGKLTFAYR